MLPDITVAYYYSEGGTQYRATHNWNFQNKVMLQALTPNEQAFAYGIASHLIADSVSHTLCVPEKISATHIPNWLLHPLLEKKYDSLLANSNPGLKERTTHMLDAILYGPHGLTENGGDGRYIEMVEEALDDTNFDVEANLIKLGYALGSFYKEQYRPEGGGLFALYPMIDSLTDWVYPLSTSNMDVVEFYVEKSLEENQNILTDSNWGTRTSLSPHGFVELNEADKGAVGIFEVMLFGYVFLMFALPIFLMWWRRDPRWLALIALMFFILIAIMALIYILV